MLDLEKNPLWFRNYLQQAENYWFDGEFYIVKEKSGITYIHKSRIRDDQNRATFNNDIDTLRYYITRKWSIPTSWTYNGIKFQVSFQPYSIRLFFGRYFVILHDYHDPMKTYTMLKQFYNNPVAAAVEYCSNCGSCGSYIGDSKYCPYCGAKREEAWRRYFNGDNDD